MGSVVVVRVWSVLFCKVTALPVGTAAKAVTVLPATEIANATAASQACLEVNIGVLHC
jgi:hypothetical protein